MQPPTLGSYAHAGCDSEAGAPQGVMLWLTAKRERSRDIERVPQAGQVADRSEELLQSASNSALHSPQRNSYNGMAVDG